MSKDDKIKELTLRGMEQDRQKLLMRQPFIGMILMHLDFVPITSGCRTACTDGSRVFMNCKFYAQLDLEERLFVLAHETWHCVLLHFARLQNRNHKKFNIATDLEIHFILQKEKMKEPFVLPHDPNWDGLSAEEIYEKLGKSKKRPPDPGCCSKGFEGNCEEGKGFDEHIYKNGSDTEGAAEEINAGRAGEIDPDFAPQVDAQSVEKMRQIIIQSAQTIERTQGRMPGFLQSIIEKLRKPELNWKELLKQFVTSCYGGSRRWLPPARRYVGMGLYLQSYRNEKFNAVMAIDTSGSITRDLPQFFAELSNLLKSFGNYELTVIQCDAEIQHIEKFSGDTPLPPNYQWKSYGDGGTCFIPPFEYVKEHKLRPDIFIYLTDGYGDAPEKAPNFPVLWVLTNDGEDPALWGKKIRLQGEQQ
jgi:predicted metal-dependent peptidase